MPSADNKIALLVDAKNALYSAIYASRKPGKDAGERYHSFVIFLRKLSHWIRNCKASSVHVFWDAPRTTIWRRKILPTYKDRTKSAYVEDISEELAITTAVAKEMMARMNVRQYERESMEADDLIYAAVSVLHPFGTAIVSSDSDMVQMPYRFSSCRVYEPHEGFLPTPTVNPVHLKAMVGDIADSIPGYRGIGPVKGQALVEDPKKLYEYLAAAGSLVYKRNLVLIDLALSPYLAANVFYVGKQLSTDVRFCSDEIHNLIVTHKVNGLYQEFSELVNPFKILK